MKKKLNKKFVFSEIKSTKRVRIKENRDLIKGIRLNRNERVDDFPKNLLPKIFSKAQKYDLGKYPDQNLVYLHLSRYLKIKKENLLISSGIDGSIKSIFEIFLRKGDKIACLHPTYAMYEVYSRVFNVSLVKINYSKNLKLNRKKIYNIIKSGIKVLFIPNPNQPIEDNLNSTELKKIAALCKRYKVLLVIDEAYHMFGVKSASFLIKKFLNVIVLRTLSKSFGLPSIRFGFIISNKKIIDILNSFRLSYESNFLTDHVVIYFLKNINFVNQYIDKVKRGRDYIKSALKKLNIFVNGGKSNFLLIKFKSKYEYLKVLNALSKNKIYVKGNYNGILENSILFTCGPKKFMKRLFIIIKANI